LEVFQQDGGPDHVQFAPGSFFYTIEALGPLPVPQPFGIAVP
jgi:hypothetical protein